MLELRITTAIKFKQMLESISSISDTLYIELSNNSTLFHAIHETTKVLAILHLSSRFFFQYHIPRFLIIKLSFSEIISFLRRNVDHRSGICICSNDRFPITYLEFHVHDSNNTNTQKLRVEVTELRAEPWNYEPIHEFKIAINPDFFKDIATHSHHYRTPIHIAVTSSYYLLSSGTMRFWSKQDESDFGTKNPPKRMYYELQLPWDGLAKSFVWASHIAVGVSLRDSYCSRPKAPPMLEFNFCPLSRLLFYIRGSIVLS